MNRAKDFSGVSRGVLPSVLSLWTFVVFGAGIAMSPIVRVNPLSWDDQMFRPGAMLLLETLRLHRTSFIEGARQSLAVLAAVHVVILLARARMTASIVDLVRGQVPRRERFSRAPAYLGVTLLKLILLAIYGAILFFVFRGLPSLNGTLPLALVLLYALAATLALLGLGFTVVFADLYRLAIFHELSARARFAAAWSTARHHALSLISTRAMWTVLGLGTGYLTLLCAARPIAEGSLGALGTFVSSQLLVLANLGAEAWWLSKAERKLLLCTSQLPGARLDSGTDVRAEAEIH